MRRLPVLYEACQSLADLSTSLAGFIFVPQQMFPQTSPVFETYIAHLTLVSLFLQMNNIHVLLGGCRDRKYHWAQITLDSLLGVLDHVVLQQAFISETFRTVHTLEGSLGIFSGVLREMIVEDSFSREVFMAVFAFELFGCITYFVGAFCL